MAGRKKSRSSIKQLPDDLREEVDRALLDGRLTLRQIVDLVRQKGAAVSLSAMGRYSQTFEEIAQELRFTREMATSVGKSLENTDGDAGRLVIESLQSLLLRARMQVANADQLDSEEVGKLARAAKDLQQALKANVEVELKVRDRALKDAAAAIASEGAEKGLSADVVEAFQQRVLGLRKSA